MEGSEVLLLQCQNHKLLEQFVAHQELLASPRDVSVVVEDPHATVSCDVHLQGHEPGQVQVDLGLLGRVHSWIQSGRKVIEALVSDFIDHLILYYYYILYVTIKDKK